MHVQLPPEEASHDLVSPTREFQPKIKTIFHPFSKFGEGDQPEKYSVKNPLTELGPGPGVLAEPVLVVSRTFASETPPEN